MINFLGVFLKCLMRFLLINISQKHQALLYINNFYFINNLQIKAQHQ